MCRSRLICWATKSLAGARIWVSAIVAAAREANAFILDEYPRRAWHDSKSKRLEELLGEIVAGTLRFAEILRVQKLEREKQYRLWEEEWRLREEVPKNEEAKQRAFREEVEQWNLCKMMRKYIVERERALDDTRPEPELKQKALEWIAWAKEYVGRINPLKNQFEITETRESQPSWIDEDPDETSQRNVRLRRSWNPRSFV